MKTNFLLSIIIPVYNEEKNISHIFKRIIPIISKYQYELIFVNDGSSDNTVLEIKQFTPKNRRIKLLSFTRNFGHQVALSAGYLYSKGNCVITIDADLQDPPELIDEMIDKWLSGADIVYAKRQERNDTFFKKITAYLFYRLINLLSDIPIPNDIGDYRLLDGKVVNLLNKLPEKSKFLRGLVAWGGYKSDFVLFSRDKRLHGKTHYPLSKMINFALDGITSFSIKPLKILALIGFITAFVGFSGITYAICLRIFFPNQYWVTGWATIFVSIMFFGGLQIFSIGILGEYLGKIFKEVQNRPQFILKEKVNL